MIFPLHFLVIRKRIARNVLFHPFHKKTGRFFGQSGEWSYTEQERRTWIKKEKKKSLPVVFVMLIAWLLTFSMSVASAVIWRKREKDLTSRHASKPCGAHIYKKTENRRCKSMLYRLQTLVIVTLNRSNIRLPEFYLGMSPSRLYDRISHLVSVTSFHLAAISKSWNLRFLKIK